MAQDEDDETFEPPMHPPDWDRWLVASQKSLAPAGDPTRWGATVVQTVQPTSDLQILNSQVISANCRDSYSRVWSICGTISAPTGLWALPTGIAANEWMPQMLVTMGVGQTQIVHNLNLRAIVDADAAVYLDGDSQFPTGGTFFRVRPFIIPGGIVANAISIQIVNAVRFVPAPGAAFPIATSVLVSPFAAGSTI